MYVVLNRRGFVSIIYISENPASYKTNLIN